ncbi:MAG: ATP-binding protein [Christensenellales bacterium]|jgi:signal transduction histidine kinase
MKRNVLFSRLFRTSLLMLIVEALFTSALFNYICRNVFAEMKESEMLQKAQSLSLVASQQLEDGFASMLPSDLAPLSAILDSAMLLADADGSILFSNDHGRKDYAEIMHAAALSVIESGALRFSKTQSFRNMNLVGVGVPVALSARETGALVLIMPLYEALIAMGSLSSTLFFSLLLSLPFVALLNFYAIGRIVYPIRRIRDTAMRMADGDFSVKADSSERGEIGQLGRALNAMSGEVMRLLQQATLERNRLKQVVDELNDGIVAMDALGRVTLSNPAMDGMRIALSDVRGDFDTVLSTGDALVKQIESGDRIIQITITCLHGRNNAISGAVGLFSDVTERERLERTRRDYVANVSHELRSPLTAIRALVEPMSEGLVKDDNARQRYYGIILREITRLTRLINDLMELSRLQSGTVALTKTDTDLAEILWDMNEKYTAKARENGQTFSITDRAKKSPPVYTNPDRAEQVLVILTDNAFKYTPPGGSISIDADVQSDVVTVSVTDTGVGISESDLPYVFDRFYKVDKAHSSHGSGLGLSIAKELLGRMGETIWVESRQGEGSRFSFTLHRRME